MSAILPPKGNLETNIRKKKTNKIEIHIDISRY